jgi:hypothetical protein
LVTDKALTETKVWLILPVVASLSVPDHRELTPGTRRERIRAAVAPSFSRGSVRPHGRALISSHIDV